MRRLALVLEGLLALNVAMTRGFWLSATGSCSTQESEVRTAPSLEGTSGAYQIGLSAQRGAQLLQEVGTSPTVFSIAWV